MMSIRNTRRFLAPLAFVLLTGVFATAQKMEDRGHKKGCGPHYNQPCRQVPDGGSTTLYVLGAAALCVGAIVVRARQTKNVVS